MGLRRRLSPDPPLRGHALLAGAMVVVLAAATAGLWGAIHAAAPHNHTRIGTPATGATPDISAEAGLTGGTPPAVVSATGPRVVVPILMYHYVRTDTSGNPLGVNLSVAPALFRQEMRLLKIDGAHPITFAELLAALQSGAPLPAHPVILTFDDGYADFATRVEPILINLGFRATDYVVSGFVNRHGYMTAAQVLEADAAGMIIGSHTIHHLDLPRIPRAMARTEIDGGKAALEALLGHPVLDFAYPYGGFDTAVAAMVQQAGFRDAVTTVGGTTEFLAGRYLMPRVRMGGAGQGLAAFAATLGLAPPTPALTAQLAAAEMPAPKSVSAPAAPLAARDGGRRS